MNDLAEMVGQVNLAAWAPLVDYVAGRVMLVVGGLMVGWIMGVAVLSTFLDMTRDR